MWPEPSIFKEFMSAYKEISYRAFCIFPVLLVISRVSFVKMEVMLTQRWEG